MSKYHALTAFLARQASDTTEVRMKFSELEDIVGALPDSARSYRPWWGNSTHGQALAWQQAGWIVDQVNLTAELVVFRRGQAQRRAMAYVESGRVTVRGVVPPEQNGPVEHVDTEASVQGRLATFLSGTGWLIQQVADTATKEAGIDVLAIKDGRVLAVEVKGYPSTRYADPRRAGEVKPTNPATQARHWYAQALLKAVLTRDEHPTYEIAVALPESATYRSLHRRTAASLGVLDVRILFVAPDGCTVEYDTAGHPHLFT
jgi:hypothetical protein